jgi:hypothetical protein
MASQSKKPQLPPSPQEQANNRRNDVSPVNGLPPPVEHQFRPGQSGNPGGRPKGDNETALLRRIWNEPHPDHPEMTRGEVALRAVVDRCAREPQLFREVMNRLDGKLGSSPKEKARVMLIQNFLRPKSHEPSQPQFVADHRPAGDLPAPPDEQQTAPPNVAGTAPEVTGDVTGDPDQK